MALATGAIPYYTDDGANAQVASVEAENLTQTAFLPDFIAE